MTWRNAWRDGVRSGTLASITSTAALMAFGRREANDVAHPVNGPSQWVWGQGAPHVRGFSMKHTVTGYIIHHAMSVFWAVLFEKLRPRAPIPTIAAAGITASVAYVVDFKMVPRRLSPGFDVALPPGGIFATYACFAVGLAAIALMSAPHSDDS